MTHQFALKEKVNTILKEMYLKIFCTYVIYCSPVADFTNFYVIRYTYKPNDLCTYLYYLVYPHLLLVYPT